MKFVVRHARPTDALAVAEIYVASANAGWSQFEQRRPRRVTDERVARWEVELNRPRHHWWIAELEAQPVGVAGIGPCRGTACPAVGELDTIAVLPCYWRRGVGRALMATVNRQLDDDGYEQAVLWTWSGYASAYGLYSACGWHLTDQARDEGKQVAFSRRRFGAEL